ncbi:phosphopantetheine-binding protein [Magnetovibrio sp. PR-2]|uniref:phosphopantetheine-binding protein n=1 Tax=Magnetovibrio sp. PR-2 TaxID=3120356 RepID=UPI002FCDE9A1
MSDVENITETVQNTVLQYLSQNGVTDATINVDEDLTQNSGLDSFDLVALISDLETKYNKNIDLAQHMGTDATLSISLLSALISE